MPPSGDRGKARSRLEAAPTRLEGGEGDKIKGNR